MYCPNCGKEIADNHKFCAYCGVSVESNDDNKNEQISDTFIDKYLQEEKNNLKQIKYFLVTMLALFIVFVGALVAIFVKSPEYAIYGAISAMKANNYEKTIKYINIEKIINNRFEVVKSEMLNTPELNNNPFADLAYMFIEVVKPKFISVAQDSFKNIVESPDNIFQEISMPRLLIFLIVKKYDKVTLIKTQNEPKKVIFELNNNNDNLQIELNKNSEQNWEIVDIGGYNFWEDNNSKYLEHNSNTKDYYTLKTDTPVPTDLLRNRANTNFIKLRNAQKEYFLKSIRMNNREKEIAFKALYKQYLAYVQDLSSFCYEKNYVLSKDYVHTYKNYYAELGVAFISLEGAYEISFNYTPLIKTFNIPKVWKNWLELQQKYTLINQEQCNENTCKGSIMLNVKEMENAIVELENVEKQSKIIEEIKPEHFDYIPCTSLSLLNLYLVGNELSPHFDYFGERKLYPDFKYSYEDYIKTHKNSKYYPLINSYYSKLKNQNFKYSDKTREWLLNEISKY